MSLDDVLDQSQDFQLIFEIETVGWFIEQEHFGLFVGLMLIRKFVLPEMLRIFNIVYVSDAIFVTMMGLFFGRVHTMAKQIEEIVFRKVSEEKR